MGRQPLSASEVADWPDGLPEVIERYHDAGGAWKVSVACDDRPEASGEATLTLEPCAVEDMALVTVEGAACDRVTRRVHCSGGGLRFEGWSPYEVDSGASFGADDFGGQWKDGSVNAEPEEGVLTMQILTDGALTGLVEPADRSMVCSLDAFERL